MQLTIKQAQDIQLDMLGIIAKVCDKYGIPYILHAGNLLGAVRHGGPIPWDCDTDILVPESFIEKFCKYCQSALHPKYWIDYHGLDKKSKRHFPRIAIADYDSETCHIDVFRLTGLPGNEKAQDSIYRKGYMLIKLLGIKRRKKRNTVKGTIILYLLKPFALFIPYSLLLEIYNKLCKKYPYEQAPYAGYLAGQYGKKNMFKREMFDDCIMMDYAGLRVRTVRDYDAYLKQLYGDYMRLPPESERERLMKKTYLLKEK